MAFSGIKIQAWNARYSRHDQQCFTPRAALQGPLPPVMPVGGCSRACEKVTVNSAPQGVAFDAAGMQRMFVPCQISICCLLAVSGVLRTWNRTVCRTTCHTDMSGGWKPC